MSNIKIFPLNNSELDSALNIFPTRFAYSINYIVPLKFPNGSIRVQLINYEPEKWKTWFPFYSTTNDLFDFKSKTKKQIYHELNNHLSLINDREFYFNKAKKEFIDMFVCGEIETTEVIEDITQSEIKYSQTMNVYTLYKTEYVVVTSIQSLLKIISPENPYMDYIDVCSIQSRNDCTFKKLPIVTNYCDLLNDKIIINLINKHAIQL